MSGMVAFFSKREPDLEPFTPYCGSAPLPADLMGRWNFDPWLLAALGFGMIAYAFSRANTSGEQRASFGAAWFILLVLFVSPLCALSSALFSVRVAHHLLLAVAAAPLLVLAFPRSARMRSNLTHWTGVQAIVFWVWHAPSIYAAALSSDLLYWTMQVSLLGSAVMFWSAIRRAPAPAGVAALLVSMVQMGLLGGLITFAPSPLYAPHLLTTAAWGLSPLEDQQVAGLVMWVPAAGAYLGAALLLLWRYLGDPELKAAAR